MGWNLAFEFCRADDVGNFSRFGRWGALELVNQTSSAKFDVLQTFAQTASESSANCIFGWAERSFPELLKRVPSGSQRVAPFFFRGYGTGAQATYLASNWPDQRLLALGPVTGGQVLDLGSLNDFALRAACP